MLRLAFQEVGDLHNRRDANPDRVQAWKTTLGEARKFYLLDEYGGYLHLQHLGTHPKYQRQGAGSALSRWGMELAKRYKLKIGLFASPMGKSLYDYLGFTELATIVVRSGCEKESIKVTAMVWGLDCG